MLLLNESSITMISLQDHVVETFGEISAADFIVGVMLDLR